MGSEVMMTPQKAEEIAGVYIESLISSTPLTVLVMIIHGLKNDKRTAVLFEE